MTAFSFALELFLHQATGGTHYMDSLLWESVDGFHYIPALSGVRDVHTRTSLCDSQAAIFRTQEHLCSSHVSNTFIFYMWGFMWK